MHAILSVQVEIVWVPNSWPGSFKAIAVPSLLLEASRQRANGGKPSTHQTTYFHHHVFLESLDVNIKSSTSQNMWCNLHWNLMTAIQWDLKSITPLRCSKFYILLWNMKDLMWQFKALLGIHRWPETTGAEDVRTLISYFVDFHPTCIQ